LVGIGNLLIESIVSIASNIPHRVGNRKYIPDSIVGGNGGVILGIDNLGLSIEFIVVVVSRVIECVGNGGAIANVIVAEGGDMAEGIGNAYQTV
jgi:hypothetical protein